MESSGASTPSNASGAWRIRMAQPVDIPILIELRRELFLCMGHPDNPDLAAMLAACARYFETSLPSGAFRAWVAETEAGKIIAAGGLVIHQAPPSPFTFSGREGYIMNMITLPGWRRQGIGAAILETILNYLKSNGVTQVCLRASIEGRPLYTQYGFQPSNEMRLKLEAAEE